MQPQGPRASRLACVDESPRSEDHFSHFTGRNSRGRGEGLRMYYDLNIPYIANYGELQRTLAFLSECQSSWDHARKKSLTLTSGL